MRTPLAQLALAATCLTLFGVPLSVADDATPTSNAPTGLAAITVPEGFEVTLAAGQPLVERPMLAASTIRAGCTCAIRRA